MFVIELIIIVGVALAQTEECYDILPEGSNLTCIQHAKWGRCSSYELKINGYCQKSCGYCQATLQGASKNLKSVKVEELPCFDIPPDEFHTCEQQQKWGKCDSWWMKQNFCRVTCGQCQLEMEQKQSAGSACMDVPPDEYFSCADQKSFGKCETPWMKERGFCQQTCNECVDIQNIQIIKVLPSDTSQNSNQCSLTQLFMEHPVIKDFKVAYEFLKRAEELSGKRSALKDTFQEEGFEGVILVPTDEAILRYQQNLNETAWIEIAKFHLVPGELNRDVVGPYETTLQGSSVLLIKDEFVENEQQTSGALVLQTLSLFGDDLCKGQELDVWIIDSLLFPPNVLRPSSVKQSPPKNSVGPSALPIEVLEPNTAEVTVTAMAGLDQLLIVDEDYYQYYDVVQGY